jgi:hypothetical protein
METRPSKKGWIGGTLRRNSGNRRIFGQQHLKTHLDNQSAIKRQRQGLMVLVGGALMWRWPA